MLTDESLTPDLARTLVDAPASAEVRVELRYRENHTWLITAGAAAWFLKAHTKSWYGGDPVAAAGVVRHEASAHRILAEAGLPTPTIVAAVATPDNPLGWPYLLTERLPGRSLVDHLDALPRAEADQALIMVGRHLARMHALRFDHPGYLLDGPPAGPPAADRWQHGCWRFERFLTGAIRTWAADAETVPAPIMDGVVRLLAGTIDDARAAFDPPRFTHGDCHANGFFLVPDGPDWSVTGVLDLEVASAGWPEVDLTKLFIELAGQLAGTGHRWWDPLFAGYGREPDFDLARLLLAGAAHLNYTCHRRAWPGDRAQILGRIVNATDWDALFPT